jgi:hypothetical protein
VTSEETTKTEDRASTAAKDCPNCLALRGTSRLLAESALFLIDRNTALTVENHQLRCRVEAGQ